MKKVIIFEKTRRGFQKMFSDAIVVLGDKEKHVVPPQEGHLVVEYVKTLPHKEGSGKKLIFARILATVQGEAEKVIEQINPALFNSICEEGGIVLNSPLELNFWVHVAYAWQDEEIQKKHGAEAVSVTIKITYSPDKMPISGRYDDPFIKGVFKGTGDSLIESARLENLARLKEKNKKEGVKAAFLKYHPELVEAFRGINDFYPCMLKIREMGFGNTSRRACYQGHEGVEWTEFSIMIEGEEYTITLPNSVYVEKERDYK